MGRHETGNENYHADRERKASNPKQFIDVAPNCIRPVGKIPAECFGELPRGIGLSHGIGEVNDDLDRPVRGQFASPANNIIFCLSVEVTFSKRERVEGMKKLSNVINAELDRFLTCR